MKACGFLTKTEWGLLVLTGLFLCMMTGLLYLSDRPGDAGTYAVAAREQSGPVAPDSAVAAQESAGPVVPDSAAPVDVNTASAEELAVLPGIGPVLAERIVDYREEHGPFTAVEELLEVKGIGEATLDRFREQIIVEETAQ